MRAAEAAPPSLLPPIIQAPLTRGTSEPRRSATPPRCPRLRSRGTAGRGSCQNGGARGCWRVAAGGHRPWSSHVQRGPRPLPGRSFRHTLSLRPGPHSHSASSFTLSAPLVSRPLTVRLRCWPRAPLPTLTSPPTEWRRKGVEARAAGFPGPLARTRAATSVAAGRCCAAAGRHVWGTSSARRALTLGGPRGFQGAGGCKWVGEQGSAGARQ